MHSLHLAIIAICLLESDGPSRAQKLKASEGIPAAANNSSIKEKSQLSVVQTLMNQGRTSVAIEKLNTLLAADPNNVDALLLYAQAAQRLEQVDVARDTLHRAVSLAPRNPEYWKRLGDISLNDRPAEAIQPFETAVKLAPTDPAALAGLATAHAGTGEAKQAEAEYIQAIELNNKSSAPNAAVEFLYAQFLSDNHRYAESVRHFDRALALNPQSDNAHFQRAQSLIALARWKDAEKDLEQIPDGSRQQLPALYLLVRVYKETGNDSKAKEIAARVAEVSAARDRERTNGNNIAGRMQTASDQMAHNSFEAAAKTYEDLLRDHPEATSALAPLGECYLALNRAQDAEAKLRQAVEQEPESADDHYLLGRALLREAKSTPAGEEFHRALELDPFTIDARLGISAIDMIQGRLNEEIQTLSEAKRIAPRRLEVRLMLAEAFAKSGEKQKAISELNTALQIDGSNAEARKMLNFLNRPSNSDSGKN